MEKRLKNLHELISARNSEACPIRDVFSTVFDKWSILIFFNLGVHPKLRFNELKKSIKDISSKILTERLKRLERDGYIQREVFMEVPIKVEYQLSDFGQKYSEKALGRVEWIVEETPIQKNNPACKRRIRMGRGLLCLDPFLITVAIKNISKKSKTIKTCH